MLSSNLVLLATLALCGHVCSHPMNNTTDGLPCTSDSVCPNGWMCINHFCGRPCDGVCGPNTDCVVVNRHPHCSCKLGYTGHPFSGCLKNNGCAANSDCPPSKLCLNTECTDPCIGACGVNAVCKVAHHHPICACKDGFQWNPLSGCEQKDDPECTNDLHCPVDKECHNQRCVDPCGRVCGTNAECQVFDHRPVCACKSGFIGNPLKECIPQCPGQYFLKRTTMKKKFVIINDMVKWTDAIERCRLKDMELASIESLEEQLELVRAVNASGLSGGEIFLSAIKPSLAKDFYWINGRPLSYSNWKSSEPSGTDCNCLTVTVTDYEWISHTYTMQNLYACEFYE